MFLIEQKLLIYMKNSVLFESFIAWNHIIVVCFECTLVSFDLNDKLEGAFSVMKHCLIVKLFLLAVIKYNFSMS